MTKTAAVHRAARRLVLRETVKSAQLKTHSDLLQNTIQWLDPARAGGTLLSVGGGLVLGDVLSGNRSFLRRLGQTLLGGGLGYAGYKMISDPGIRQKTNDLARSAYSFSRASLQRLLSRFRPTQP